MRVPSRTASPCLVGVFLVWVAGCGDSSSSGPGAADAGTDAPTPDVHQPDSALDSSTEAAPDVAEDSEADSPLATWPGVFSLGDFRVSLDEEGRPDVTHVASPGRSLFSVPKVGGWVSVAETEFEVQEHQGSFSISETLVTTCAATQVQQLTYDGATLVIRGGFVDGIAPCAATTFEVSFFEVQAGHLGFRVRSLDPAFDRVTLRVASQADERVYGMGEQVPHETLNLKGRQIPVLSQEGGVGRGHPVITPAVDAVSPGSGGSEASTYYAAPHYLTSLQRSLFLENTEVGVFDFRQDDVTEVRLYADRMDGRILRGDDPLTLIERFTEFAGRMPPLPDWVNEGAVVALAKGTEPSLQLVDDLRAHGVEVAGVWNQTWSGKVVTYIGEQVLWNWVSNPTYHPGWGGFVDELDSRGIRTLCYVNPMFVEVPEDAKPVARNLYEEGVAGGYFVHDAQGGILKIPVTAFDVALLDLTNPAAWAWMKDILQQEVMGTGRCSGWMVDFAEALPFEAVLASGVSAASYHNQYPVDWMRLNREAVEDAGRLGDIMLFNRAGHTRTPAYSLLLWQGDQLTTWDEYDGLVSAMRGLINGGLSGIALNHSDIGGYTSLSQWGLGYSREPEQLMRWAEMSAFTSAFRTHEGNQPAANAQVYTDAEAMAHFARMSKVYKALAFYRSQLFQEAWTKGWPVVRHLMLHYPDDAKAHRTDDQFLLGSEILVAPIKNKCWTWPYCPYDKETYFPAGEWVHLWTGEVFGNGAKGTMGTVKAPLGSPAVFYRKGSTVGATFVANLQAAGIVVADPP
jgi:alpha-glucosidase